MVKVHSDILTCKHNGKFILVQVVFKNPSCSDGLDMTYAFKCPHGCGYALNFDPDWAGRYKSEEWIQHTVAYKRPMCL